MFGRMIRELVTRSGRAIRDLGKECVTDASFALLIVTAVLVTRHAASTPKGAELMEPIWTSLADWWTFLRFPIVQRQVMAIVLQLGVALGAVLLIHRRSVTDFGLGLGDTKFWVPITGMIFVVQVAVIALYLSEDPTYVSRYPSLHPARNGGKLFWMWECSRIFYMLSWEFLFRGYLLFALRKRMGMAAVVVQMVPFVLMHIVSGKPVSEIYFTIFSGLLSGLFVMESRSVWPVVFLHGVGAVLLDIFIVFG